MLTIRERVALIISNSMLNGTLSLPIPDEVYAQAHKQARREYQEDLDKLGKKVIEYDLWGADRAGLGGLHPQDHIEALGGIITKFEGHPIADCVFMEVYGLPDKLPDYIRIRDDNPFVT